jgi:FOG: PKD repeat
MKKHISLLLVLIILFSMPTALATGNVKINSITATSTVGTVPFYDKFTGHVTGKVTSWAWKFHNIKSGATTYSTESGTAGHTFKKPGVYDVTLTVKGPGGSDTLTKKSFITAKTNQKLIANFAASPVSGKAPLKVHFTDKSTGIPTYWSWTFGDGGKTIAKNPTHTYKKAGRYTVSLTVKNYYLNSVKTVSKMITVK